MLIFVCFFKAISLYGFLLGNKSVSKGNAVKIGDSTRCCDS